MVNAEELMALLSVESAGPYNAKMTVEDHPSIKLLRAWERRTPSQDLEQALAQVPAKMWERLPGVTSLWALEKKCQYPNAIAADIHKMWRVEVSRWPPGSAPFQLICLSALIEAGTQEDLHRFNCIKSNTTTFLEILKSHRPQFENLMRQAASSPSQYARAMFNALPEKLRQSIPSVDPVAQHQNAIIRHFDKIHQLPQMGKQILERDIHPLLPHLPKDMSDPTMALKFRLLFSTNPSLFAKTSTRLQELGWSDNAIVQMICPLPADGKLLTTPSSRALFLPLWVAHHPKKLQDAVGLVIYHLPVTREQVNTQKQMWSDLAKFGMGRQWFDKVFAKKEVFINWHRALSFKEWHKVARAVEPLLGNPKHRDAFPSRLIASYALLTDIVHGRDPAISSHAPFAWPAKDRYANTSEFLRHCSSVEQAQQMYDWQEQHIAFGKRWALHAALHQNPKSATSNNKSPKRARKM